MQKQKENEAQRVRKANKGKSTIFGYDISGMSSTTQLLCVLGVFAFLTFLFWFLINRVTKQPERSKKTKKDKKSKAN